MTNILDNLISQRQNAPAAFTFDPEGKVKPMADKGRLLPSRLFDSPIEYAKDLKQDVLNIGKAAKGQANDHELGRINDLAMKLGSLGLASYLFVKNPTKLGKAMEFVGFGTFFASMALWPKLAIQLPIKMRTGIDVNQKYIDSQGRKKKVSLDPQYVLTDLYSKEELDKIGKKLGVNENLPDRDNFIKQRMQKTSLQANTLAMITAGVAAPTMGALTCNVLEKPIGWAIEQGDLISSKAALKRISGENATQGLFSKIGQVIRDKSLGSFLEKNADKALDEKMIDELSKKIAGGANSATIREAVKAELSALKNSVIIDEAFVREALSGTVHESVLGSIPQEVYQSGSVKSIAKAIATATTGGDKRKLTKDISGLLNRSVTSAQKTTIAEQSTKIGDLARNISEFVSGKNIVDKYVDARVGDRAGSFVANQWGRFCNKMFRGLKLSSKELKAVANGDTKIITDKLAELAKNEAEYNKFIENLMKVVDKYESVTATGASTARSGISGIFGQAKDGLEAGGFSNLATKFSNSNAAGTVAQAMNVNVEERIAGAESSFFRLIQALDFFKKANTNVTGQDVTQLTSQLRELLTSRGLPADDVAVSRLTEKCKDVLMSATTTDYIEKLKSLGFELSEGEYKTVMDVLCDGASGSATKGLAKYKERFRNIIANWKNEMTPELERCVKDGTTGSLNGVERNNIAAKPVEDLIKDAAKQAYNSKKWLKIFGGTMIVVAAVAVVAGLSFGRKSKVEKQAEEEIK